MTSQPRRPPVRGFTSRAREIVREHPGLTAQEVAKLALRADPHLSNAHNPVFSLATTLEKQVRMGAEADIEARRVNGVTRYYPKGGIGQTGNSGGDARLSAPTVQIPTPQPATAQAPGSDVRPPVLTAPTQGTRSSPDYYVLWIGSVYVGGPRDLDTLKHLVQELEAEERKLANG